LATTKTFGRYELLDRISAGGMAEVFRARDTKRGTIVALKRILPQIAADDEFIELFEDEARVTSQLEHPHIARTLDFGHVNHAYFIAFEYVHGKDLRTIFDRAVRAQRFLALDFLLYIFTRIGEGLSYAHARKDQNGEPVSIVHRDVSPQNIVLSTDGDVKLIDFGIAKAAGQLSRTQVGTIKGKYGYMSPEQVSGIGIDARTDVFSMGICMWELLTLKRLFHGENELIVLQKIRNMDIEPPSRHNPDVPPELDRIVLKALAKDVNERYRAAKELYRDLNTFSQNIQAVATREEMAQTMRRTFPELANAPSESDAVSSKNSSQSTSQSGSRGTEIAKGSERPLARQEMGKMAAENKGSDLDIFEGLGKKNKPSQSSAPPPAPPPSMRTPAATPSSAAGPQIDAAPARKPMMVSKKTLMGIPAPAASNSAPPSGKTPVAAPSSQPPQRAAQASNAPPAGRGSLPAVSAPPRNAANAGSAGTVSSAPAPASTRPAPYAPNTKPGGIEMDWDDENEATHVFDKDKADDTKQTNPPPAHGVEPAAARPPGSMPAGAASRPPPVRSNAPPPVSQRLSGNTKALSAPPPPPPPPGLSGPAKGRPSGPPPPPSLNFARTAPSFTPPPQLAAPQSNHPQHMPQGNAASAPPPSMQPQIHTAPMPMPNQQRESNPPPGHLYGAQQLQQPSQRPPMQSNHPHQVPLMQSRSMEATQMVRPQTSHTGLIVGAVLGVIAMLAVGLVFLLLPHTGKLAVTVSDGKGSAVNRVDIFVDGKRQCETSPCMIESLSAGRHEVKVLATGFEVPTERSVLIEARKDSSVDFIVSGGSSSGTGLKVSGAQAGVKLFVDGREIGPLPQEVHDLTPGDHKIRLAGTERYESVEKNVTVAKDEVQDLGSVLLKVVKGKATITLGTPGAKVYIVSGSDRRDLQMLPISVDIDTSKSWGLEASKPGFNDYKQPISFADGQAEKVFSIVLDPKGSAPAFSPPPPAAAPAAPRPPPAAASPPADKPVAAAKPAPADAPAAPDKPAPAAAPPAGEAFLNINSLPASLVILDGKPLGNTPKLHVSVKAGDHTVVFVNSEQSLKKSMTVTVAAGETKPVIGKLRE
jgi:serine/threonine protein kinase